MKQSGGLGTGSKKMKPKKLFSKLFPSYFLISVFGLAILLVITRYALQNFYFEETAENLIKKAKIIGPDMAKLLQQSDYSLLQKKITYIAGVSQNRITIIRPDGKVIADSGYDPAKMENHLQRQEIEYALKGEVGRSMRFSSTLNENHLYVALPLRVNENIIGVLRNAVSIEKIQTSLKILTQNVLIWSFFLLLILTYIIYELSKKISSPLEEMKVQIENFAAGNFKEKIQLGETSTAEISSLFSSVKAMSEKLQDQFEKITKQKNEQLAVFSSMLEGVITIYPDMNIYHINQAAIDLFNYKESKTIKGTPLREVVKSERIYQLAKNLLIDHQTVENEFEYESGMVLVVHGTILRSKEMGMLGAVLVFNDVSKIRGLENHRKQFVANVSHELKTPLTVIQGYLETIREEDVLDKATLNKFLDIINSHSLRLHTIIEDLLTLSSIERDSEADVHLDKHPIGPVIENAMTLCKEKALKKNIEVKVVGESIDLRVNPALMEQAIINLLDNAIKYGPENSIIVIKLEKHTQIYEIRVTDKGQGIDPIHHERLFERFYSANKARSRELGGSGLGLSIVKHISLYHGGNVRVESVIGRGSSFIIELPLEHSYDSEKSL